MKEEMIRHRSGLWRTLPCRLRTTGAAIDGGEASININGSIGLGCRFHCCDANPLMWRNWTKLLIRRHFPSFRRRSIRNRCPLSMHHSCISLRTNQAMNTLNSNIYSHLPYDTAQTYKFTYLTIIPQHRLDCLLCRDDVPEIPPIESGQRVEPMLRYFLCAKMSLTDFCIPNIWLDYIVMLDYPFQLAVDSAAVLADYSI